jgi:hypothetical protein
MGIYSWVTFSRGWFSISMLGFRTSKIGNGSGLFLELGCSKTIGWESFFHDGICILCFQQVSYVAPLDPYWEHHILSSATNSNRFPTDEIKKSIVTPKKMQKRLDLPRFQWKFILFCIVLVVPQNWSQTLHQAPKGSRKAAVPWQCRQGVASLIVI